MLITVLHNGREISGRVIYNFNTITDVILVQLEYMLADKCYYQLLRKHERKDFKQMTPSLKKNLLGFYSAKSESTNNSRIYKPEKTARFIEALKKADVTKNELVQNNE